MGSGAFALRAWLDPSRMAALDVTAAEINEVIRRENYISAAGSTQGAIGAIYRRCENRHPKPKEI